MTTSIEHKKKVAKPMLWISMASMAMVFVGLTSAYVVRKAEGNWLDFDFPIWFYISAIVIALSSVTMILAKRAIKHSDNKRASQMLGATFALGVFFCYFTVPGLGSFIQDRSLLYRGRKQCFRILCLCNYTFTPLALSCRYYCAFSNLDKNGNE